MFLLKLFKLNLIPSSVNAILVSINKMSSVLSCDNTVDGACFATAHFSDEDCVIQSKASISEFFITLRCVISIPRIKLMNEMIYEMNHKKYIYTF